MTTRDEIRILSLLRSNPLLADMENKHLKQLAAIARVVEFPENKVIYTKGSKGQALYLIEKGEIVIETRIPGQGQVIMNRLGPGHFFGWSALFPSERKMAWTRTTKPTRVVAFDAEQIRTAWQTDHNLEYAVIRRAGKDMAERIKATRQQLIDALVVA
jgi:CRP-like cAMP-binding protein